MILQRALAQLAQLATTKTNYVLGYVFDGLIFISLIVAGVARPDIDPYIAATVFAGGLFLFSFIEYFFHRWLFHKWIQVMIRGHQQHHDFPLGYDALPFFVPSLVFFGVMVLFQLAMPLGYAFILTSAVVLGYMTYGFTHFAVHHFRFRNIIAKKLVAYHQIHHHHPEYNFGVTSALWDIFLGTRYRSEHRRLW